MAAKLVPTTVSRLLTPSVQTGARQLSTKVETHEDDVPEFRREDFKFGVATKNDAEQLYNLMINYYVPRNELFRGLGLKSNEDSVQRIIEKRVARWIDYGVSCQYTYKSTNEIAAIALNEILNEETKDMYLESDLSSYSEPVQHYLKFLHHMESTCNIFDDPSVKRVINISSLLVPPKFEGAGLAGSVLMKSFKLGKSLGCQMGTGVVTNIISQNLIAKLGCKPLFLMNYEDFEIDGKKVVNVKAMHGTTKAGIYYFDMNLL